MKKVLSVLLAAAMVMGMSVSAFAAPTTSATTGKVEFGGTGSKTTDIDAATIDFDNMIIERDGKIVCNDGETLYNPNQSHEKFNTAHPGANFNNILHAVSNYNEDAALKAGDVLYFTISTAAPAYVPTNWTVKLSDNAYVDAASLVLIDGTAEGKDNTINNMFWQFTAYENYKKVAVKLTVNADFDSYDADRLKSYFFVYDTTTKNSSERVTVNYPFADYNYEVIELSKTDLDWVIEVDETATYKYTGSSKKVATINFNNKAAFVEFTMYPTEKYTLGLTAKYNKELSKEYDADIEVMTIKLDNVGKADLFFPASKDAYQVVAVVDGELVPVEATFETAHKFSNGSSAKGYYVDSVEYDAYAVIDADVEIEVEAEVEAPVEADKANPETGAADFVGAAVAMAVVSVAAAGALALKK